MRKHLLTLAVAVTAALWTVLAWAAPPEVPAPPAGMEWLATLVLWVPSAASLALVSAYVLKTVAIVQTAKRITDWILTAGWLVGLIPGARPVLEAIRKWMPVVYNVAINALALVPILIEDGLSGWDVVVLVMAVVAADQTYKVVRDGEVGAGGLTAKLPSWLSKLLTLFPKKK